MAMTNRCINIPSEALREFKHDKRSMRMLAFSLLVKARFGSSALCLSCHSTKAWSEMFGCDRKTFKTLVQEAKGFSRLFSFDEAKNILRAKSLHKLYEYKAKTKRGYVATMAYCVRVRNRFFDEHGERKSECPKFKYIVKELRKMILKTAVKQTYFDELDTTENSRAGLSVTNHKGASIIGTCKSTFKKYLQEMKKAGEISVSQYTTYFFYEPWHFEDEISDLLSQGYIMLRQSKRCGWVFYKPNLIHATGFNHTDYRNVIFSHKKRKTFNAKKVSGNAYEDWLAKNNH